MIRLLSILALGLPLVAGAAEHVHLDEVDIDLQDKESLRHGARVFTHYCLSCHSASYMRYQRLVDDLGIKEDELRQDYMFASKKIGATMKVAMQPSDAENWFNKAPPDLSVIARSRGADWLYTYLRSFYLDSSRPWGVNNLVFDKVGMPHVLWRLQGLAEPVYETNEEGNQVIDHLELTQPGALSPDEYDALVADLVNYLVYMGEPAQTDRRSLGIWVILYLLAFAALLYLLKRVYWKDVH